MSIAAPPAGAPGMSAAPAPEAASVPLPAAAPASVEGVAPTNRRPADPEGSQGHSVRLQRRLPGGAARAEQPWRVRLSDLDTGNVLFETELKAGRINSTKRYYVRFRTEVSAAGRERVRRRLFGGRARPARRFPVDTLGRSARLVPVRGQVQDRHGCRLTCMMMEISGPPRQATPTSTSSPNWKSSRRGAPTYSIALPRAARCSITRIACPTRRKSQGTQSL